MPRSKKPSSSEPPPPTSSELSLKAVLPLPVQTRQVLEMVLTEAERQINETLFKSWHRLRTNPELVQAERRGAEEMKLRVISLLTGGI